MFEFSEKKKKTRSFKRLSLSKGAKPDAVGLVLVLFTIALGVLAVSAIFAFFGLLP